MSKYRAKELTVEDVKFQLDREQACLQKIKGMIQQQLKVLQAEAATIQRFLNAQDASQSECVRPDMEREPVADLDPTSDKLPELNLGLASASNRGSGEPDKEEMDTDSESEES